MATAHELLIRASSRMALSVVKCQYELWDVPPTPVQSSLAPTRYEFYAKRPLHPASKRDLAFLTISNSNQMFPGDRVSLLFEVFVRDGEVRRSEITLGVEGMYNGTRPQRTTLLDAAPSWKL